MRQDNQYDDIIFLKHHESKYRPRMSIQNRAFQFAPFSALSGYTEALVETARITDAKIVIDDNIQEILDYKMQQIKKSLLLKPKVTITYFVPDKKKEGGCYQQMTSIIKAIDEVQRQLVFTNHKKVKIDDIITITSDCLKL